MSPEINKLMKLETLSLSFNSLKTFSLTSASKLKHVKTLNLNNNKLKEFPIDVCQLPNLDVLDLSNNFITSIPVDIEKLEAIELNLNKNRLKELTDSLSKCKRLKVLRIEENCLALETLTPTILKSSQISLIVFNGNLFDMKQFQDVDGYDEVGIFLNLLVHISYCFKFPCLCLFHLFFFQFTQESNCSFAENNIWDTHDHT